MKPFVFALLALLWAPSLAEDLVAEPDVHGAAEIVDPTNDEHGNLRRRRQCSPSASVSKPSFAAGEQVNVIINICQSHAQEWFGIYPAGSSPGTSPAVNWQLTCGGQTCQSPQNVGGYIFGLNENTVSIGSSSWPLPGGSYVIYYHSAFGSVSTSTFSIAGGSNISPSVVPTAPIPNTQNAVQQLSRPIRVACVGDSLTEGNWGLNPVPYPNQLATLLSGTGNYAVYNFGVSARTATRGQALSYDRTGQFGGSLFIKPDIYLLMLGHNDVKNIGGDVDAWTQRFETDFTWYVQQAKAAAPSDSSKGTRVILALAPWVKSRSGGINDPLVANLVQPVVRRVASSEQVQLVDLYSITRNQPTYYVDKLHMNPTGNAVLAQAWFSAIQCNQNGVCEIGETCSSCPLDCFVNC